MNNKKINKKNLIMITAMLMITIITGMIIYKITTSNKDQFQESMLVFACSNGNTYILKDGEITDIKIDGSIKENLYNFERNISAVINEDEKLYYITSEESLYITENIKQYCISLSGNVVAYIDNKDSLYIYDSLDGNKLKIADNMGNHYISISPDGKIILCMDILGDLYVFNNGESKKLSSELTNIAVSNNGEYIYAYNPETKALYYSTLESEFIEIANNIDRNASAFCVNKDFSQILYKSDETFYITVEGTDKYEIGDYNFFIIATRDLFSNKSYGGVAYYMISEFKNNFYYAMTDNIIDTVFINKEYEKCIFADSKNIPIIIKDKTILYTNNNKLYKTSLKDINDPILIDYNVESFYTTFDMEKVYYINNSNELWCQEGSSNPIKIFEYDKEFTIQITNKNVLLIITEYTMKYNGSSNIINGKIYAYDDNKEEIEKIMENIDSNLIITSSAVYLCTNYDNNTGEFDIYVSNGDKNFSFIMRGSQLGLNEKYYSE